MPEVGSWATIKHEKISYYSDLFSTSMKKRWDCRVYIDLFAGAGKSRIKTTREIVPGSPLLALNVKDKYDKYVFCEKDPSHMEALQARVKRYFPHHNVSFILGDTNDSLEQLFSSVPVFRKGFKGLTLCFVDPYNKEGFHFSTIRAISSRLFVDFLVLIPSYMDIHRNENTYTLPNNPSLDRYLGTTQWREEWCSPNRAYDEFGLFIADQFCKQMQKIGYLYESFGDLELIRANLKNRLKLYHLAFFSKNQLGLKFWRDTKKNTNKQMDIFSLLK